MGTNILNASRETGQQPPNKHETRLFQLESKGSNRGRDHLMWVLLQFLSGSIQKNPFSDFLPILRLIGKAIVLTVGCLCFSKGPLCSLFL